MSSLEGFDSPELIFSTARYDPLLASLEKNTLTTPPSVPSPYSLLPYHRDRLVQAARAFAWEKAAQGLERDDGLKALRKQLDQAVARWQENNTDKKDGPLRLRLLLSPTSSELTVEAFLCNPITPISNFFNLSLATPTTLTALSSSSTFSYIPVKLDSATTHPSLLTRYKTTSRDHYLASRDRAGLGRDFSRPDEVLLFNSNDEVTEGTLSNVAFYRDGGWVTPHDEAGGLNGVMRRWLLEQGRWKRGTVKRTEVSQGEWVLLSNGLRGCFVGRIQ